jgi:tetratricopeptide (TPR) repeat protein
MKALQLDSTLAEAHTSLAWSKYVFDWDWQGADREYKQAIELNPSYANAHHWYAAYLSAMGRNTEAIAEDRKAESLDPLSLIISVDVAGEALAPAGLYDQAMQQCRKTLEMDPNFARAHACLADIFTFKGMYKEAVVEIQKAIDLSGNLVDVSVLGYIYAVEGRRDEAIKILNKLKEQSKYGFVPAAGFVLVYAGLGDRDQAFSWAQRAYANREDIFSSLMVDPRYKRLRSDPRFQDLLRRVSLSP